MAESRLVISDIEFPLGSARGITQTLTPIGASSQPRRTINGELINTAGNQFRKYASTISCRDQRPPTLEGIWPGMVVTVDCIAELWFITNTEGPIKTVVDGSEREEGSFTFYNPRLEMMILDISHEFDEYGAECGWSIQLEEV